MKTIRLTTALLLTLCLFTMCKKDPKKAPDTPNSVYYVKGSLGGQTWNWQVTPDDKSSWVVGSWSQLTNDQGNVSGGIIALVSGNNSDFIPQLGVEFKTFNKGPNDDAATVFNGFVTTGAWTYATDVNYTVSTKSVVVWYTDKNGKQYSSVGAQSGASFNVISSTPVSGDVYNIDPGLKIKLTFNCKLYPTDGTGDAITIANTEATVFLDDMLL